MATTLSSTTKYGHLSKIDPSFAPLKEETDKRFNTLWSLPMKEFLAVWLLPLDLPEDIPKDLNITQREVPVSDGTQIEIQLYKSKTVPPNALLYLKVHGGGWVVGSHGMEEAENRWVAARNNAVVVSVAYRL
jgi:acetyl esterase/lipase